MIISERQLVVPHGHLLKTALLVYLRRCLLHNGRSIRLSGRRQEFYVLSRNLEV
jgi:hypothetical protein